MDIIGQLLLCNNRLLGRIICRGRKIGHFSICAIREKVACPLYSLLGRLTAGEGFCILEIAGDTKATLC